MNINDFKDAYSGIRATPEFKKRVLEKAAEQEARQRKRSWFNGIGAFCGAAAAMALIVGGGYFIRWLNINAEPTIVVTAGEIPDLSDAPAPSAGSGSGGAVITEQAYDRGDGSYGVTEMPALFDRFLADYSFTNVYDELFNQSPSVKYSNLYEWVEGENISEEKAREMLADTGLNNDEIEAIAKRNKALCEKMFTMNAYRGTHNGETVYYSAKDLYLCDVREFYTLYAAGITVDDMKDVLARMIDISGGGNICCYAMERKALLYESYVLSLETDIEISESWAREYFSERVTTLYSPFEDLFDDEQVGAAKSIAGEPTVNMIFNYYMLIKRTGVSEEAASTALEQCKNEAAARIFKDSEIDLIVGNDSYLFAKHFLSPYAAMSYQNMSGGSLIVTAEEMIRCGAYGWLVDYGDIDPMSVSEAVTEKLAEGGYGDVLDYCERQLELYEEICEITEKKLGGAVLSQDMRLLRESKPALTDSERGRIRQLSFTLDGTELTGETIYECDLNYLLCFGGESVAEAIGEVSERLNNDAKKWLTVKKNLYRYQRGESGFTLYNEEYIGALLDDSAYSWRLSNGAVYVDLYYASLAEYLGKYHITNIESDEYAARTLYSETVGEYIVAVEAQVGEITGEGYYNTLDNTRLCLYSHNGTLLSYAYSSNGMAGLDGYMVYVAPDEKYFDVYHTADDKILIVLRTFYPERYREEGEAFTIDNAAKLLKRFDTSAVDSDFYESYGFGMFDYGEEGFTSCSDSEPVFRNEKDGQLIRFDFETMLMRPADETLIMR